MLGAGFYPITIAELHSYSRDADRFFERDEHEKLKEFLAFNPEGGDVLEGTGGVRLLHWPIRNPGKDANRIIYYFRDLNMPLFLLAVYRKGERIKLDLESKRQMEQLVNELVEQYSKKWARVIGLPESG